MIFLEAIARRELEPLMDVRVIGEFDARYLWVDICLAKITYAYFHYLGTIFSPEKREKVARIIAWKIWLKTTAEEYTRIIEGYNFDKSFVEPYQAHGIFIEAYKSIYEIRVGNGGNFKLYRNLFVNFLDEENIHVGGLYDKPNIRDN